jgi:uncharacterized protein GlcG (DUF336 family)
MPAPARRWRHRAPTDGQVVGAIGVSGAASADQDEQIAIAGAAAAK